jgi:hypothetical protein
MVSPPTAPVELLLAALPLLFEPLVPLLELLPLRNANGLVEVGEPTPLVLMIRSYLSSNGLRAQLCPSFNVASIMSREVLSTSTSFW